MNNSVKSEWMDKEGREGVQGKDAHHLSRSIQMPWAVKTQSLSRREESRRVGGGASWLFLSEPMQPSIHLASRGEVE